MNPKARAWWPAFFLAMLFALHRATNVALAARVFATMVLPVHSTISGVWSFGARAAAPVILLAIALGGCSFDLGSWSSAPEKEAAPQAAPTAEASAGDAHGHATRAQALAKSGKVEEALAEFGKALTIDPHHAEALYNRGLLYQRERQHQLAIDDFTTANGLTPQRAEPLLARAISYLAMDKFKEAAADLDEAVQADPQNALAWATRGQAYERLGDKDKAKASYGRALAIRPRDEVARTGLVRVGG
jgi:Tfp pilus assembly protein PilF